MEILEGKIRKAVEELQSLRKENTRLRSEHETLKSQFALTAGDSRKAQRILAEYDQLRRSQEQATVRVAGDGDPNVFLVVDRSADMRVEDLAGGRVRMAGARDDIAALIDRYPDARFAVIAFASRPSLDWPLSA